MRLNRPQQFFFITALSACMVVALSCNNYSGALESNKNSQTSPSQNATHWVAGQNLSPYDLLAVDFVDNKTGWAVGDISPEGGPLLRTTDGGTSWQMVYKTTEVFAAIQFVTPTRGWMAGFAGRIESTTDGGLTWKTQRLEREGEVLNSLCFIDAERGFAAGGRGLLLATINGGNSWEPIPTNRVEDFWAIRFASPERGVAVGEDGLILATTDGGKSWAQKTSGTTKALLGLTAAGDGQFVVVGEDGTILRSETGADWTLMQSGTNEMLSAVAAADNQTLWAVGSRGTTVQSTDGGKSWALAPPVANRHLLALDLISPTQGVAVGRRGAIQKLE
jgi:photosystem II stability/assembly factor-like uncharacterized protein